MTTMNDRFAVKALISGFFACALAFQAHAAGSDDTKPPEATETTMDCTDGMVWDTEKKECVEPEKSGFNDSDLYKAAREMAYAGQYENAIKVLKVARNQNDPRILNYLGYANRKAGRIELGMTYYRKALAIDGNYLLARSYMGQALVQEGDIEGARMQLVEIRDRGGRETYAYDALYNAIKRNITY